MENQTSSLSIPSEWHEHFFIKRIDEEDIKITLDERNAIIEALNRGARFAQIGKYTLMINSIKSIDPVYEPDNIPPCPKSDPFMCEDGTIIDKNETMIRLWKDLYELKMI